MSAARGRPLASRRLQSAVRLVLAALCGFMASGLWHGRSTSHQVSTTAALAAAAQAAGGEPERGRPGVCVNRALLPPKSRLDLGELLEQEGAKTGAELGVQRGEFSKEILQQWAGCERYTMVDLWRQQENYEEAANVDDAKQEANYQAAQLAVAPWAAKTHLLRMKTSEAAGQVEDASLDFVYIDARHDYCGCSEDIALWWPKVKPGGIMAGHDYMTAKEILDYHPNEDWGLCENGTRNEGAVVGAVANFALQQGLTVAVTYKEWELGLPYASWLVRRPC